MRQWFTIALLLVLCFALWRLYETRIQLDEAQSRLEVQKMASRNQIDKAASAVVDVTAQDKVAQEQARKATEVINAGVDRVCRAFAVNKLLCTVSSSDSPNPTPLGCVPAVASYEPPVGCESE
jgi:predicted Holliday junction resolvase-like endonuclease